MEEGSFQDYSSDSDSDCQFVKYTKKKKTVVGSNTGNESSGILQPRNKRLKKSPKFQSVATQTDELNSKRKVKDFQKFQSVATQTDELNSKCKVKEGLQKFKSVASQTDQSNSEAKVMNDTQNRPPQASAGQECNGQPEGCSICLESFTTQEVGSPDCCEHTFCLQCIVTCTKEKCLCPMDRQVFRSVKSRKQIKGKVIRSVEVMPHCQVCHQSDGPDGILICNGCGRGFHMVCMDPSLEVAVVDDWVCRGCQSGRLRAAEEAERHRLYHMLIAATPYLPNVSSERFAARLVARCKELIRMRVLINMGVISLQRQTLLPQIP